MATRTGAIARVSVRSGVVEDPRHTRNLLIKVPKFKLLAEQGRKLRLDDDAEQKLLAAAKACNWKPDRFELFRDVIILARDTGMRNGRELYRVRAENLDWNSRVIFVPDSKTADGRRMIPMSDRVLSFAKTTSFRGH